MTPDLAAQLTTHLQGRKDEMVEVLDRLVQAESPSGDPALLAVNLDLIGSMLGDRGYRVRRTRGKRGGGNLLGVPQGRRHGIPVQLLVGHCDTVWPVGTAKKMDAGVRNGAYYGPGAFDMKAGLVQGLFALSALGAIGVQPFVTPVVFVDTDEETGSEEAENHLRLLARAADRVWVLEPALGTSGKLKTQRKGGGDFLVTVRGKPAHAGLDPEKGASAILALAGMISRLHALSDLPNGISVNVGTVRAGTRPNVVAAEAVAEVDFRALTADDLRTLAQEIREVQPDVAGTSANYDGGIKHWPLERNEQVQRLWALAQQASESLGLTIEEGMSGGASDGNTTARFAPTLDGLGPVGDGAHAEHEHVIVDRMPERAALLAMLLVAPPLGAQDSATPAT
ncbi:MAG: M20/M25/M40 family metallo-hydrolase [Gemmatimonadota bacterium]